MKILTKKAHSVVQDNMFVHGYEGTCSVKGPWIIREDGSTYCANTGSQLCASWDC